MYITVDNVKQRYPALAEQFERGTVTAGRIERWISDAESLVNAFVSHKYDISKFATNPPPFIINLVYTAFLYYWQADIYKMSASDEVPWLVAIYDRLLSLLREVRDGVLPLLDAENAAIQVSLDTLDAIRSNQEGNRQIFTMGSPEEQAVDANYDREV